MRFCKTNSESVQITIKSSFIGKSKSMTIYDTNVEELLKLIRRAVEASAI